MNAPLSLRSLALVAGAAAAMALHPAAASELPVVTSTTVLADLAQVVGGPRVRVTPLAPAGADPHTFQPTPNTMRTLAGARVIFFNGSGLEDWWDRTMRSVKRPDVPAVELSRGLATLTRDARDGGRRAAADPHVWLDPARVRTYVDRIRDALAQADPAGRDHYAERARAYSRELDELDAWIRGEVEKIPAARRKMVTFHNAFQYFASRYGLVVKGYVVASPGKEPSAKALAELARRIKQEQIPAVFAEADFNPKLLELLAGEAGVKVVTNLYDGSLSDGPPADTYLNLMRHNVRMIAGALR
jgi:ABC-type Zn uptake system ZnuABC Zn-binding protein ZnuA